MMASSPTTSANKFRTDLPPWKIELIQRRKKVVNVTGGCHSIADGIDHHHISSQLNGADLNADKHTNDSNGTLSGCETFDYPNSHLHLLKKSHHNNNNNTSQHHYHHHPHLSGVRQMDAATNGSSSGENGHSHFQPQAMSISTAATAVNSGTATAHNSISNGTPQQTINNIPVSLSINSVVDAADALRSSVVVGSTSLASETGSNEVGANALAAQHHKTNSDNKKHSDHISLHQFNSRYGGEHTTIHSSSSATTSTLDSSCSNNKPLTVNSLVSERKLQLEQQQASQAKYAVQLNKSDSGISNTINNTNCSVQSQPNRIRLNSSSSSEKTTASGDDSAVSSEKSINLSKLSVPNDDWQATKRNSLCLLIEEQRKRSGSSKMVAMQELSTNTKSNNYTFDDTNEELQYGPGIVSKLRCRYLSLALRQTVKQRPTLDNLRRATSLNNLLDEEEEEEIEVDDIDDDSEHQHKNGRSNGHDEIDRISSQTNGGNQTMGINRSYDKTMNQFEQNAKSYHHDNNYTQRISFNKNGYSDKYSNSNENDENSSQSNKLNDSRRQTQRGNDSLKRARSVEALMRYDTLAWRRDVLEDGEYYSSSNPVILDEIIVSDYQSTVIKAKTVDSITIEDKIQQARDRIGNVKPPKRLTSFMSDQERPPPDLVKQTLLKFEATANRRARTNIQRYGNGDVAAKVATYKSKFTQDRPMAPLSAPITSKISTTGFFEKQTSTLAAPTLNPITKKPLIKPRTTSPKPVIIAANGLRKSTAPSVAPTTASIYNKINHDTTATTNETNQYFNGVNKPSVVIANMKADNLERNTNGPSINVASKVDPKAYRNSKSEVILSPESPNSDTLDISRQSYVHDIVRKREYNINEDSPTITELARKTSSMTIQSAVKKRSIVSDLVYDIDEAAVKDSIDDFDDDATSGSEHGCSESYYVNLSDSDEQNEQHNKHILDMPTKSHNNSNLNTKNSNISSNGSGKLKTVINVAHSNSHPNGKQVQQNDMPEPSVRQIGIIRPLVAETKPPVPCARSKLPSPTIKKDALAGSIKVSVAAAPIMVSTQHSVVLPSTTSSLVFTNSVSVASTNDSSNDVVVIECSRSSLNAKPMSPTNLPTQSSTFSNGHNNRDNLLITNLLPTNNESAVVVGATTTQQSATTNANTISIDTRSIVHHKNLLNKEKSEEINNATSPSGPSANGLLMLQSPSSKQRASNDVQTTSNTVVFNFSNRKEVPDYIENDGLVIRRKRELPKPGESGFVLLGDLTVETSTDPEPDDAWICDPPSPCDVLFKNDNVIINGKSSLRDKSRDQKHLSLRFNEELISTFEYPSEHSLSDEIGLSNCDDDDFDGDTSDILYNGHFFGNSPIASVPLSNYTPTKANIFNSTFELGVTRGQTSSPNTSSVKPPPPPPRAHHKNNGSHATNGTITAKISSPTSPSQPTTQTVSVNGTPMVNGSEPESLQYLKPASDDQTVAWSEGASDLLF